MDWKKLGKKLLFLPVWLLTVLSLISAAALVWVFVNGLEESPVAYAVYVLAFYTLTTVCVFCAVVLPKRYKQIRQKIYDNPFGSRYMTDMAFRTHVSLYLSLFINLLYVGVNVFSYVLNRSMWFIILAVYYTILAVMRFVLLRYARRTGIGNDRLGELKSVKFCSWVLLTVNFVLSGAVLMILYQNKGFVYGGMLIYVMAAYTFYMTTHAIIGLVKYRKRESPVITMTKVIALSAALVSMLSLETAMFSQFGQEMAPENQRLMIALTGAGVSVIVLVLSVYMIAKSAKEIKMAKGNKDGR